MRVLVKALSLLAVAASTTLVAKADSFTLTGEGNTFTFSIAGSPVVDPISFGFIVSNITVTENGVSTPDSTLTFYDSAFGGGLAIQPNPSILVFDSDQLYSGTNAAPTFLPGTFKLTDDVDGAKYKLVIAADPPSGPGSSPVPEPSSLALIGTGALVCAGMLRSRFRSL
jgi:hypothetical protein